MQIIKTGAQIGQTIKNVGRLRTIVGVFVRHGFYNIAEKIKLGRFIIERISSSEEIEKLSVPERIRLSFEELGPTFVKLGQILSSRPDLIPVEYVTEFEKLQDKAHPLDFSVVEQVLKEEFGAHLYEKFSNIDPNPIGSASIAQVHRATLASGEEVVIKVQRPGIVSLINEDLSMLYMLAELLHQYVPETRSFNLMAMVDEYFKTLTLETNFIVEANNIRKFQEHFQTEVNLKLPHVYWDLTTERVLTLEKLQGFPLNHPQALTQEGVNPEEVIKLGLKIYLKMVFADGFFHGDLHAGNFFILPNNQVGLIDFGLVGRLNRKRQNAIANMLIALAREDYERLAYEYVDLAPFTDKVNVDLFAKDLQGLISPYFGLNLKNINIGKLLMSSSEVARKHHLSLPPELLQFFRSIILIEGIGRKIYRDFDFLKYTLDMANDLLKHQFDPTKVTSELTQVFRESRQFISNLPRQLNFLIKKMNSPDHFFKFEIRQLRDLKKSIESSSNLLFLGVIISSLILSASLLATHQSDTQIAGVPTLSFVGYILSLILGFVAFINYIKKP